jgi:TatD DNase family protein
MHLPGPSDFIDIHNHGSVEIPGVFVIENLMAHEDTEPSDKAGMAFSYGIHPWFLNKNNSTGLLLKVKQFITHPCVIGTGEAGFDKLKGPDIDLQRKVFREQVALAEEIRKPVIIHCVRSWDELLLAHKQSRPAMPWLVHGFRGNRELAAQLVSKGMYLSFWFDFIMRPESTPLIQSLPADRIFLETDGSGADIRDIYIKVSTDLGKTVEELKKQILSNFNIFFNHKGPQSTHKGH